MKKRTLATVILSVLLLLIFCVSASALGESPKKADIIKLNETKSISFKADEDGFFWGEDYFCKFVPTETTDYQFSIINPLDDEAGLEINDINGDWIESSYYNKYTQTLSAITKLEANKTYYIRVYSNVEREVNVLIVKHTHTLKQTAFEKCYIGYDGESIDGYYILECSMCDYYKSYDIPKVETIKLSSTKYYYNGKVKAPILTVKDDNGKNLKLGTDYTVSGTTSSKDCGNYNIKLVFKGNYSGKITFKWKIIPAKPKNLKVIKRTANSVTLTWNAVAGATNYFVCDESGDRIANVKTTKAVIYELASAQKHTFNVYAVVKSGTANVLSDKATISVVTLPRRITDIYAEGRKGKAIFKWYEDFGVDGYQVVMATKKNGKYKIIRNVGYRKGFGYIKIAINKLKPGTYYFKVRSYVKYGKTVTYGNWSRPVAAKVK